MTLTDSDYADLRERLIRIEEAVKGEAKERRHVSERVDVVEDTLWGPNRDNGLVSSVQTLAVKASVATGTVVLVGNYLLGKL